MLLSTADIFQFTDISNDDEEKERRGWDLESVEGNKRKQPFSCIIFSYNRSCVLREKTLARFLDAVFRDNAGGGGMERILQEEPDDMMTE